LLGDKVDSRNKNWDANEFQARCGRLVGTWDPSNDSNRKFENETVLRSTVSSINTSFASIASKLDLCDIRDMAKRLGVKRADGTELLYVPSSILGVNEISPLSMAGAMAGFSNQGVYCSHVAIDRVLIRRTQTEIPVPVSRCTEATSPDVAKAVTYALRQVISSGTGTRSRTGDGVPIAGKTGTTNSALHTWMMGYSTEVATATWVGNVSGTVSVTSASVRGVSGGQVRHEIWRKIMKRANELYGGSAFPAPPSQYLGASKVIMPDVAGMLPADAEEFIKLAGLNVKIDKVQRVSPYPVGTVASANYEAGSEVIFGSLVTLYISNGGLIIVPEVAGLTVSEARSRLEEAGFSSVSEPVPSQTQYFVFSSTIPAGRVVSTSPEPGTLAEGLGAILLIISKGPS
jgi:membrane peptidoglycan carboxypeptidase